MGFLKGTCGSKGYCCGNAVIKSTTRPLPVRGLALDYADEIAKFRRAQNTYFDRLALLADMAARSMGEESAGIFRAYQVIVKDEAFFKNAFARVERESVNIEYAVDRECKKIVPLFDRMDDDYMRERAVDIENVCNELINIMLGVDSDFSHKMEGKKDVILVADNLTPAETIKLDKSVLRGIVTELGGVTSHTVILAKALGIPAIVGVENATLKIRDNDFVLLDGFHGEIEVNPGEESLEVFAAVKQKYDSKRELYGLAEKAPAVTKDGYTIAVNINAGDLDSTKTMDISRFDGIGLFRTEFIFLGAQNYPTEEEQFAIYKDIASRADGKQVIIRTLDVGGDKQAGYMNLPLEENPFLGFRAIRISLKKKDVFGAQLRAILRSSVFGNVKLMFPMIVTLEELIEAKSCVETEKQRLKAEGIPFREDIPIGIMIETPAAVMISDILARECDFFSIGSNDLIQYTTAADRMNTRVENLYDFCNISVLRLIRKVAENAASAGITWGICGEAASEERLVPLWAAMGASELSVVPSQVGAVKRLIDSISRAEIKKEVDKVLSLRLIEDVKIHMDNVLNMFDAE